MSVSATHSTGNPNFRQNDRARFVHGSQLSISSVKLNFGNLYLFT